MDWTEFRDRLRATQRDLTDRCFLVVSSTAGTGAGYVQFAAYDDLLSAEASGPAFTRGAAAHDDDDPTMLGAGWVPPTRSQPNWSFELPLPALTSEYAELAERCVVALRDVFHCDSPGSLGYRAWREPAVQPEGTTWSQEQIDQLDPGADPLPLPSFGVAPAV